MQYHRIIAPQWQYRPKHSSIFTTTSLIDVLVDMVQWLLDNFNISFIFIKHLILNLVLLTIFYTFFTI